MLSDRYRPVIEATLPWSASHRRRSPQRFYQHMFTEHPELLDGTFNRGNQAEGSQQQALAGSIAAFASALVETPERCRRTCCRGSRTSTPRSASAPTSTRSCTTT